jgi:hypothetical protein
MGSAALTELEFQPSELRLASGLPCKGTGSRIGVPLARECR